MNPLVEKYLKAIDAYDKGTPIMSDDSFDILEEQVKKIDPEVVKGVGARKNGTHKHPSPILSLDKIKVLDNDNLPLDEIEKWFNKNRPSTTSKYFKDIEKEVTAKFDGNAVNLVYVKGILTNALSRSDDNTGFDYYKKLLHIVPKQIATQKELIEIRGEVVIPKKAFEELQNSFSIDDDKRPANERNYVTGLLSSDAIQVSKVKQLKFIAIEVRVHQNNSFYSPGRTMEFLPKIGFNETETFPVVYFKDKSEFKNVFKTFLDYREVSPYRLDGMVIKLPEELRAEYGANSHDPNWGYAVKFIPKDLITEIIDIESSVGTTGEIIPTAVLKPIELDGTIVKRASLSNWGLVATRKAYPGAMVLVAKAGDIIPQIYKIVKPSEKIMLPPTTCPSCGSSTKMEGIHLWCSNPKCIAKEVGRISKGLAIIGTKGIGEAAVEKLYTAGIESIVDYFDFLKFNKYQLINSGKFTDGRSLEIILDAIFSIKKISLADLIASLAFEDVGKSMSKQLANYYMNLEHDFTGLTKTVVKELTDVNSEKVQTITRFRENLIKIGVEITHEIPTVQTSNSNVRLIKFEMTGSPKDFGFETKDQFKLFVSAYGSHVDIKDADVLITDDLSSNTGKMGKAKKLGKEILTYSGFINKYKI